MNVMLTVGSIVDYLKERAPLDQAAEWDNVGLLLGDPDAGVERIMTCLTVTPESAAEAVAERVDLIVAHHPILFRPVQRLTGAEPEGRLLLSLAKAGLAVYSAHTAFDNCAGGINDVLCQRLGLAELAGLRDQVGRRQCKFVVFVPDSDLGKVSDAIFAAGAGQIGQYRECSFRLGGTGTFFGSDETNPTVGQKGRREEVAEWRLETVCPIEAVAAVITAMRRAHSYEEPAFDVYPLEPAPARNGIGRIGRLPQPITLSELARRVKAQLAAECVQTVGEANRLIERVAVACGAGGDLLSAAVHSRADALLTGELRFHDLLRAQACGLALVLPGHYASERCGMEELAGQLQKRFPNVGVWPSRRERDPSAWVK